MTVWPNQITTAKAGKRPQFRFAVHDLWPGLAEFQRSAGWQTRRARLDLLRS
jgi:hypothetical protein